MINTARGCAAVTSYWDDMVYLRVDLPDRSSRCGWDLRLDWKWFGRGRLIISTIAMFVYGCCVSLARSRELVDEKSTTANGATGKTAVAEEGRAGELPAASVEKQELPLFARIDALLADETSELAVGRAEDGELLRRLSLDLRGVVPVREELDAFVADSDPAKWANWARRFLDDPLHGEFMVDWLDRTLLQRRPFQQVDRAAWIAELRELVDQNASIVQIVERMFSAPWWNRSQRAAQRFFLDRGGDPNSIARDIGRVFLGRDLQCAQCHDHPLVDDYLQTDYHGLLAFVSSSGLAEATYKDDKGADQKVQLYVERPSGDSPFESVFKRGVKLRSGPRMIDQCEQIEAYYQPDQRTGEAKPDALAGALVPPKLSRRQSLGQHLTDTRNSAFARNWANRLWALAFSRGLVHPLDMHHADNPPSDPALLDLLAKSLVEMK